MAKALTAHGWWYAALSVTAPVTTKTLPVANINLPTGATTPRITLSSIILLPTMPWPMRCYWRCGHLDLEQAARGFDIVGLAIEKGAD
jgi:hypothetical protein